MKKLSIILISLLFVSAAFSQKIVKNTNIKKFGLGMDITADFWSNLPEGISTENLSRGFNLFGMYNHAFKNDNFSFAVGIGLGTQNVYLDATIDKSSPDTTRFIKIPDTVDYKRSKLAMTYLDLPFEFRLKTNSEFRMAIGFKAGLLIGKNTKYKGKDVLYPDAGTIINKSNYLPNLQSYRYGPTFRVGYKWLNVFAYYQLSDLFKPDQGPEMNTFSVGITLMPY